MWRSAHCGPLGVSAVESGHRDGRPCSETAGWSGSLPCLGAAPGHAGSVQGSAGWFVIAASLVLRPSVLLQKLHRGCVAGHFRMMSCPLTAGALCAVGSRVGGAAGRKRSWTPLCRLTQILWGCGLPSCRWKCGPEGNSPATVVFRRRLWLRLPWGPLLGTRGAALPLGLGILLPSQSVRQVSGSVFTKSTVASM